MEPKDEDEWWIYFLIPWIAAIVGWGTNVIALEMTFRPMEFWGCELWRIRDEPWGLFGWQGIIPTKAEKMATVCFELFTTRLFNVREIFQRLDPVRFSEVMSDPILLMMDSVIHEVATAYMPLVWQKLPKEVKDDIVITADIEGQAFMAEFMQDMQDHVDDVVDIKHMTVQACVQNKALIVQIFKECGDEEFVFIRRSGFYLGFIFGLFQMGLYFLYKEAWTLPAAGFAVGWLTNYIALKVIFRPLHPTKILCWNNVQGIFLKRQNEVSAIFARIIMTEIMHIQAIWDAIFTGPLSKNFFAMLRAHTLVFVDKMLVEIKPIAIASLGAEAFAQMKEDIAQKVISKLPTIIDHSYQYSSEALDMENTVREKMQRLPPAEFEGVL